MRRMTYFVMALALVLGFTQCKKEQPTPQTQGVRITLTVNGGNSNSRVIVDPTGNNGQYNYATVNFESGDVIYVGYNNAYVGTLTYSNGTFDGTVNISETVEGEHLHFYFLGGVGFEPTIDGSTATVVISDQTTKYPVISYSPSKEVFSTGTTSYSAVLKNKISIMKFNVTTDSEANICITGMNNLVMVNFNPETEGTDDGFTYGQVDGGLIKMKGQEGTGEKTYWAIVLPQEAWDEGEAGTAYTDDGFYTGVRPEITDDIASNQYLNAGVEVDLTTYTRMGTPLTFEARTSGVYVGIWNGDKGRSFNMEYSKNGGAWTNLVLNLTTITLNSGETVSFRGNNVGNYGYNIFCDNGQCYIYGNIMSLLHADDYPTNYTLSENCFYRLFYENWNIDIPEDKDLVLPATTLAPACYAEMFLDCHNLTKAPMLPAEVMAEHCYDGMFNSCSNLTTAPALPAETLAKSCYAYMFEGCTSLTTAPELPAETLANACYDFMFSGCENLTTAPELPAPTLVSSCYRSMFKNCSSLNSITCLAIDGINGSSTELWLSGVASTGTFYADPSATWPTGNSGIPTGWTRLNPDGSPWVEPVPTGAINGLFSVNATQQVWFSQGNLLNGNGGNFADNQYIYGGLLQWAASFTTNYSGDWRALTSEEWNYLFTNRTNASNLWGFANVQDSNEIQFFNGIILLPDGSSLSINTNHSAWDNNSIDNTTWSEMEANGAVFLPAAGYIDGSSPEDSGKKGYYWCSTSGGYMSFGKSGSSFEVPTCYVGGGGRRSVRLVINAQ